MKKFTFTFLPRLLGLVFLWMNLGHAPDLHAQTPKTAQDFATRTLTDAGNNLPTGIWSDGTTMWVADIAAAAAVCYKSCTKCCESAREYDIVSDSADYTGTAGACTASYTGLLYTSKRSY